MKTSILYYGAFLLVVLSSVLFGLDWQPAPMPAMPEVDVAAYVPPPPAPKPAIVNVAPGPATAPNLLAPSPVAPPAAAPAARSAVAPVAQTPPQPKCDVAACAAAYRTFRESDCSYSPNFGERRLCTKGVVPPEAAPASDAPAAIANPEPDANPPSNTPPNAQCNVSACAAAYRSFRESDCTFNPSFGPRQRCAK